MWINLTPITHEHNKKPAHVVTGLRVWKLNNITLVFTEAYCIRTCSRNQCTV